MEESLRQILSKVQKIKERETFFDYCTVSSELKPKWFFVHDIAKSSNGAEVSNFSVSFTPGSDSDFACL
jgi:hypothetical protein